VKTDAEMLNDTRRWLERARELLRMLRRHQGQPDSSLLIDIDRFLRPDYGETDAIYTAPSPQEKP
jgi:hypothetical protein